MVKTEYILRQLAPVVCFQLVYGHLDRASSTLRILDVCTDHTRREGIECTKANELLGLTVPIYIQWVEVLLYNWPLSRESRNAFQKKCVKRLRNPRNLAHFFLKTSINRIYLKLAPKEKMRQMLA